MSMHTKRSWPDRDRPKPHISQMKVTQTQAIQVITNGGPTLKTLRGNYFRIVQCPKIGKLSLTQKDSVIAQIWGIRHHLQQEGHHFRYR